MTFRARARGLVVLAACMAVLGCGSDDEGQPIPAAEADGLLEQLASIQSRFENSVDACLEITEGDDTNTAVVDDILGSLPQDVEARDALEESFDRLFQLTSEQCAEQQAEPDQTDTGQTDTTDTDTAPTDTEPTDTTDTDVPTDTGTTDTGTDTTDTGVEPPPDGTTSPDEDDSGGAGAPGEED